MQDTKRPDVEIRKIRFGNGSRAHILYAHLYINGDLEVSATLDYIYTVISDRVLMYTKAEDDAPNG